MKKVSPVISASLQTSDNFERTFKVQMCWDRLIFSRRLNTRFNLFQQLACIHKVANIIRYRESYNYTTMEESTQLHALSLTVLLQPLLLPSSSSLISFLLSIGSTFLLVLASIYSWKLGANFSIFSQHFYQ